MVIALQWLHVLLSIFWFGSQLYFDLVVRPALAKLSPEQRAALEVQLRSGRARHNGDHLHGLRAARDAPRYRGRSARGARDRVRPEPTWQRCSSVCSWSDRSGRAARRPCEPVGVVRQLLRSADAHDRDALRLRALCCGPTVDRRHQLEGPAPGTRRRPGRSSARDGRRSRTSRARDTDGTCRRALREDVREP